MSEKVTHITLVFTFIWCYRISTRQDKDLWATLASNNNEEEVAAEKDPPKRSKQSTEMGQIVWQGLYEFFSATIDDERKFFLHS